MTYKEIVLDALENEDMLTTWEQEFIQDLAEQELPVYSAKQMDVLDQIERTLNG